MLREFSASLSGDVLSYAQKQADLLSRAAFSSSCFHPFAAAFRKVLRSHLPTDYQVSRGFVVTKNECSTLQEVIIHDRELIPLFAEGDLIFLSPNQAKVVVGIYGNHSSESTLRQAIQETAQVGELMKQSGRAQGLVAHWLPNVGSTPPFVGFEAWTQTMANRNIPSFLAWGTTHCFCRHINCDPKLYVWQGGPAASAALSPSLASLLSLIWYHLLQHQKTSPFRDWFAEDNWREKEVEKQSASPLTEKEALVHLPENTEVSASSRQERYVSSSNGLAVADAPPAKNGRRQQRTRNRKKGASSRKSKQPAKNRLQLQQQASDQSNTPVHLAVLSLDEAALQKCVEQQLDLNSKNKEGNTSLHLASQYDLIDMAEMLVDGGADLNSRNYVYDTPLHIAINHGNNRIVKELLEAGAEVEARNNRARTPLHQAAICGNQEAVLLLLEHFADVQARMEKDMLPLHLASWYGQNQIVDLLIERGADMNAVNSDGNTALHFAAFNGQVKVIKQLINYHADTAIPNHSGETYLQGINEGYSGEVIRVLE